MNCLNIMNELLYVYIANGKEWLNVHLGKTKTIIALKAYIEYEKL